MKQVRLRNTSTACLYSNINFEIKFLIKSFKVKYSHITFPLPYALLNPSHVPLSPSQINAVFIIYTHMYIYIYQYNLLSLFSLACVYII